MKPIFYKALFFAGVVSVFLFWMFYEPNVENKMGFQVKSKGESHSVTSAISKPSVPQESYQKFIEKLQADLFKQVDQANISKEDILRGWYWGGLNEKKFATPDAWILVEEGGQARWMSPHFIEEKKVVSTEALCEQTAGHYEEQSCLCAEGSQWKAGQGCILLGKRGSFVAINAKELEQGFYLGLPNEKKLNTPESWFWQEAGKNSSWRKD